MEKQLIRIVSLLVCFLTLSAFAQPTAAIYPDLRIEALEAHNKWRSIHHAPALTWDLELQRYAEQYASLCIFKHSEAAFGENLAAGYPSITSAINAWYAENEIYSYLHPGYTKASGHFTQIIWVATQKLGCALAACNGRHGTPGNYLVCEYNPPGNITNAGYFEKNVKSP
ncbi:MAG TPA: CAP domain-containing protein [Gammaproteobacteria bacterium]|nr:CAP domain-containing protein [Gammaproteobacteria bacterium]